MNANARAAQFKTEKLRNEEEMMAAASTAIPYPVENTSVAKGAVVLLGRLLFAAIFLMAGPKHFTKQAIGYATSQGVPLASIMVPISGLFAIAGGLSSYGPELVHHGGNERPEAKPRRGN
jgi:hypothetical protein